MALGTKKTKTTKHKGSIHGGTPFMRWGFVSLAIIAISLVIGIGAEHEVLLTPRQRFSDTQDVLNWLIVTMTIPYIALYVMVFVSSLLILSQSSFRYIWWIIRQAGSAAISYMVITIAIAAMLLGLAFAVSQPGPTSTSQTTDLAASQMWVAGHIAVTVVCWGGYRSAWTIYRIIGAQTMQQRYEADVAKMEVATSGRFWDKWISRPIQRFFAKDGHKPRFTVAYIILTVMITTIGTSAVTVTGLSLLMPVALLSTPAIIVLGFAACAKYRDGRYNQIKPPVLDLVRDHTTKDTYNPASKGHKVFVSK